MFYNNEQSNYEVQNVVLGAGIAGLGYAANSNPRDVAIFEKEEAYGGLCRSFQYISRLLIISTMANG